MTFSLPFFFFFFFCIFIIIYYGDGYYDNGESKLRGLVDFLKKKKKKNLPKVLASVL